MYLDKASANLIFTIALRCEAISIIEHLKLKKNLNIESFNIYQTDNIFLCITGIGQFNISSALSFMAGAKIINKASIIINIGIAGSKNHQIGDFVEINKIGISAANDDLYYKAKNYYPTKLCSFNFLEAELITHNKAVTIYPDNKLVDMEGFAFFATAIKFVSLEQIWLGKIISDSCIDDLNEIMDSKANTTNYNKDKVTHLIKNNLPNIDKVISFYLDLSIKLAKRLNHPQEFFLILEKIHFSFAQKVKLKKLLLSNLSQDQKDQLLIEKLIKLGEAKKIIAFLQNKTLNT